MFYIASPSATSFPDLKAIPKSYVDQAMPYFFINVLWAAHQVHHSSEDYNLTTALRQSAFQGFGSWPLYLPMAFFVPPAQAVIHKELNLLYQFWIHTELVQSIGPLELVLNTASHHRVHHGANRYCLDKNYAGLIIIWDRMFG